MARKDNWFTSSPIVMLEYRMIPLESAYSHFIAMTGKFMLVPHPIISIDNISSTNKDVVKNLIHEMHAIDFSNKACGNIHSTPKSYVPPELKMCEYIWLRVDRVRNSLEAPYSGSCEVISRTDKYIFLNYRKMKAVYLLTE